MTAPRAKHRVPDVVRMVREYRETAIAQCSAFHIVFDDGNFADTDVKYCLEVAETRGDIAGMRLARVLLECSVSQRRRIARMAT